MAATDSIEFRARQAAAFYGMTYEDFSQLAGFKRLNMIETMEGKTYTAGQYDLLDDVEKDLNAARVNGWLSGVGLMGKTGLLFALVLIVAGFIAWKVK